MNKPIIYRALRQFLLDLGFVETPLPKAHVQFKHPPSGTLLVFRAPLPEEPVPQATLVVIRKMLVENGLMERPALEERLEEMAAQAPV